MEATTKTVPLTPLQEHLIIKEVLKKYVKIRFHQVFHVVNSKWWSMWKDYVRFDEANPQTFGQRPDQIDNENLLVSKRE